MNRRYLIQARMALVLSIILGTMLASSISLADTNVPVTSESGKYIKVSQVSTTIESDGLHVEGQLQRKHFGPRGQIAGEVLVSVHDSEGNFVMEKILKTSSRNVPKGIRKANFSDVLEGSIPEGAKVTVTSLN